MKWFKAIHPDREELSGILKEFGYEGYGKFLAVMGYCQENNYTILTVDLIINALRGRNINKRSAQKLLPMFQECFTKVSPNIDQTFTKHSPNIDQTFTKVSPNIDQTFTKHSPNIDQTFTKHSPNIDQTEAENPRGRNKNITRLEESRSEESRSEEITPFLNFPQGGTKKNETPGQNSSENKKPASKGATALPKDWEPNKELIEWCKGKFPNVDIEDQTERFKDYWIGNGKKKQDWDATWRNWIRNSGKFDSPARAPNPNAPFQSRSAIGDRSRFTGGQII